VACFFFGHVMPDHAVCAAAAAKSSITTVTGERKACSHSCHRRRKMAAEQSWQSWQLLKLATSD